MHSRPVIAILLLRLFLKFVFLHRSTPRRSTVIVEVGRQITFSWFKRWNAFFFVSGKFRTFLRKEGDKFPKSDTNYVFKRFLFFFIKIWINGNNHHYNYGRFDRTVKLYLSKKNIFLTCVSWHLIFFNFFFPTRFGFLWFFFTCFFHMIFKFGVKLRKMLLFLNDV